MMKYTLAIAVATFAGAIPCFAQDADLPGPAAKENTTGSVPVAFAEMPDNLRLVYSDEKGGWVEFFRGREGDRFVMERQTPGGDLTYVGYYNLEGHLVKRHYASGNVRTFTPHHCERVIGQCSFQYRDSDGDEGVFQVLTVADEEAYVTAFWELDFAKTYLVFVPGQYNLAQSGYTHRGVAYELIEMKVQP